jgi:5,10-methylenetetrahydromethanopterin reductase
MPPIYVAAVGPKALQQAGRIADGVVLSLMSSRKYIAWAAAQTAIGITAAGRPALPIVTYVPLAVADTTKEAIAALKPVIAYYIRRWAPIESLQLLFTDWGPITRDELLVMAQRLDDGQQPASVLPDDLILEYCIAGDIDECRRQIRGLAIAGVTDIIVDPSGDAEHKQSEVRALAHLHNIIQKEGL